MQIGNIGKFVGALALCAVATFAQAQSGDPIKIGQVIGAVGSTGRSTGPHLHYEIRINNAQVNNVAT